MELSYFPKTYINYGKDDECQQLMCTGNTETWSLWYSNGYSTLKLCVGNVQ